MKIALITGSCGLVGSESSIFFAKKGFKVLGIDNNSRKFFFGKDGDISWVKRKLQKDVRNYEHYQIDIRNYKSLKKIFSKFKKNIKLIIHAAAQPSHDWAKKNLLLTSTLIPKVHLIYSSSQNYFAQMLLLFLCQQTKFTATIQIIYLCWKKKHAGKLKNLTNLETGSMKQCLLIIAHIVYLELQKLMQI